MPTYRDATIKPSEITPKDVWLNRRQIVAGADPGVGPPGSGVSCGLDLRGSGHQKRGKRHSGHQRRALHRLNSLNPLRPHPSTIYQSLTN